MVIFYCHMALTKKKTSWRWCDNSDSKYISDTLDPWFFELKKKNFIRTVSHILILWHYKWKIDGGLAGSSVELCFKVLWGYMLGIISCNKPFRILLQKIEYMSIYVLTLVEFKKFGLFCQLFSRIIHSRCYSLSSHVFIFQFWKNTRNYWENMGRMTL